MLHYDQWLAECIDAGQPIEHGTPEEVEIRACPPRSRAPHPTTADDREIDYLLWNRGQQQHYKTHPRYRCRCTAY